MCLSQSSSPAARRQPCSSWGDTGTGKSETIEALRGMAEEKIRDLTIIADDMGSLELDDEGVLAFGTETGAFMRLDDLRPVFAFGQIDRAIIMSAGKTNARIILPVTDYASVVRGVRPDVVLYANNYDEVDAELANRFFSELFDRGMFIGQLRTRLGIPGAESQGPREAARALLELIAGGYRQEREV